LNFHFLQQQTMSWWWWCIAASATGCVYALAVARVFDWDLAAPLQLRLLSYANTAHRWWRSQRQGGGDAAELNLARIGDMTRVELYSQSLGNNALSLCTLWYKSADDPRMLPLALRIYDGIMQDDSKESLMLEGEPVSAHYHSSECPRTDVTEAIARLAGPKSRWWDGAFDVTHATLLKEARIASRRTPRLSVRGESLSIEFANGERYHICPDTSLLSPDTVFYPFASPECPE
jgi:hypothetical protein